MLLLLELSTTTSRREPRGKWTDNVAQATTVVVARRKYDTTRHPIRAGHQRPIPHSSSQAYRVSHKTFRLKNAIVIHSQLSCCMYLSWDHLISKWQAQPFYADIFKIFHLLWVVVVLKWRPRIWWFPRAQSFNIKNYEIFSLLPVLIVSKKASSRHTGCLKRT